MPIVPGGRGIPLTFNNRMQYVEQAVYFRLHEMDVQVIYQKIIHNQIFLHCVHLQ